MKKKNKNRYTKITIRFKDDGFVQYKKHDWDDYNIFDKKFVVIVNNSAWIGMYSLDKVSSVELT